MNKKDPVFLFKYPCFILTVGVVFYEYTMAVIYLI